MPGKQCAGQPKKSTPSTKESKSFCEGVKARGNDAPITDVPHADGSRAYLAWRLGWFATDQAAGTDPGPLGCCAPVGVIPGVATSFAPIWDDPIALTLENGEVYPIADLNDFIILGSQPITFTIDTGALPSGITLNGDGTFSGTTTDTLASGSTGFLATNAAGAVASGFFKFTVG